jgi:hypothetical protein
LAAAGQASQDHAQLLADSRIPLVQRQEVAAWLGRTRGNRYLQRLIDPASPTDGRAARLVTPAVQREGESPAPAGGEGPAAEAGGEPVTLEKQLQDSLEGASPDAAVATALFHASEDDRRGILANGPLLAKMRSKLSAAGKLEAAQNLAFNLDAGERSHVASALYDLSAARDGKIRDATGLLILSVEEVERNTAQRILKGDVVVYYMEELRQPPNVDQAVTGYGRDPAVWTLYLRPDDSTADPVWIQTDFEAFSIDNTNIICGRVSLSLDDWRILLVHETNHARNPEPTTPLGHYQHEFRAYWVEGYASEEDPDERARLIKAHILDNYPPIRAVYDADRRVRQAINAYTRPTGNVTNL